MLNDWTNNQWIQFISLSLSIIHHMPHHMPLALYKLIWIDLFYVECQDDDYKK